MQQLKDYISAPPPGYAVLLSGEWGVGKSFYWQTFARSIESQGFTALTISAAGLESLEDLERALLQVSISGVGNETVREAGALIGKALLRLVKIDPKDIKLRADIVSEKTVVCIDDVERFAGKFAVLFGFTVNLLDNARVHCVLIADESKASKKFRRFGEYKERIVGKTIRISPDREQFCSEVIESIADMRTRNILAANKKSIMTTLDRRQVQNLRTVRFMLTELQHSLRTMPKQIHESSDCERLIQAYSFWVATVAKNSNDLELVSQAFSISDLGIVLAMHSMRSKKEGEEETKTVRLFELLQLMQANEEAMSWPRSLSFVNMINGRSVDYDQLALDFGILPREKTGVSLFDELRDFRSVSDVRLQELISIARTELQRLDGSNLQLWFDLYKQLHYLSVLGLTPETPKHLVKAAKALIKELNPEQNDFKGLEYFFPPSDDLEISVRNELDAFQKKASEHVSAVERKSVRTSLLRGEKGQDQTNSDFVDAESAQFCEELLGAGDGAIAALTTFFRIRLSISNGPDFFGGDRRFANELANLIRKSIKRQRPKSLRDSALDQLTKVLDLFVAQVDNYKK